MLNGCKTIEWPSAMIIPPSFQYFSKYFVVDHAHPQSLRLSHIKAVVAMKKPRHAAPYHYVIFGNAHVLLEVSSILNIRRCAASRKCFFHGGTLPCFPRIAVPRRQFRRAGATPALLPVLRERCLRRCILRRQCSRLQIRLHGDVLHGFYADRDGAGDHRSFFLSVRFVRYTFLETDHHEELFLTP